MFKFINRKRFLKSLKPGQIIRHQGTISNIIILFEFGHYDDSKDRIYWQTARVQLGRRPEDDVITNTASVQFDGKLFEQIADIYKNGFSLASKQEIKRFDDAYDKFITNLYCNGKISKTLYIRPNHDMRLSRLQLAIEPPVYLYIKSESAGECIFKAAPLTMTNDSRLNAENCFIINAKEMALINDKIELIPEGETRGLGSYDNILIREATDTERTLLLLHAEEARKKERQKELDKQIKHNEISNKIFKSDLKYIKINRVLYAEQKSNIYIFRYAGSSVQEGNEIIKYSKCLNIYPSFCSFAVSVNDDSSSLALYDSLSILRYANADEINMFEKEHTKWLNQQSEEQEQSSQPKTTKRDFESRLRPFVTKVLVSHGKDDVWRPAIFGCILESFPKYMIVGGIQYEHCLPYQKYRHLLGKKFSSSDMP